MSNEAKQRTENGVWLWLDFTEIEERGVEIGGRRSGHAVDGDRGMLQMEIGETGTEKRDRRSALVRLAAKLGRRTARTREQTEA